MNQLETINLPGLRLEAREIPVPAHLSERAQEFLAAAAMQPRVKLPSSGNPEAWAWAAEGWEARILPQVEPIAAVFPDVTVQARRIGDCTVHEASRAAADASRVLLYFHGGGLVFGGGRFAELMAVLHAGLLGCTVWSVDYRMPPSHPYPAPLDDCVAAYRALLAEGELPVIGGISAGGNLAAATILRARDEGLPLPPACLLLTPEVDLTESGDSFAVNADVDVALPSGLPEANALYANGADLAHPYLSPLFGDFTAGFPPTFLQTGTRDLFLSNTVRMHRALLRAGQEAELHVWEAMPHAGFGGGTPEDTEMFAAVREFLARRAGWCA